jgi:hypothetical protein
MVVEAKASRDAAAAAALALETFRTDWTTAYGEYQEALGKASEHKTNKKDVKSTKKLMKNWEKVKTREKPENHEAALSQVRALTERMNLLAANPDLGDTAKRKKTLKALHPVWKSVVERYQASIDDLRSAIDESIADIDSATRPDLSGTHAELVKARDFFDPDCFDVPILLLTKNVDGNAGDKRSRKARESALKEVRRLKETIDSHPVMPLILDNPFSSVHLGAVHRTLNKFDYNFQITL